MDWQTQEFLMRGIAVFAVFFLCSQHLSHVLTLEALLAFITTSWIALCPRDWLIWAVSDRPIDALHEYLVLHVSAAMVVPALIWFLSTDPSDVTIRTALALSRTLALGIVVVVTLVVHCEDNILSTSSYEYITLIAGTVALVYAIHLFYSNSVNADKRLGNMNTNLNMDLTLSAMCGSVCLCLPFLPASYLFKHILEYITDSWEPRLGDRGLLMPMGMQVWMDGENEDQELDELHTYLYRLYGAMILGYCCLPYIAPKFRASANKRAILFSRALSMLVTLLVTFSKYHHGDIPEGLGGKLLIASLTVLTLPSAIGSMRHEHSSGWDMPWRGLRVPHVGVGGNPADSLFQAAKDLKNLSKISPKRYPRQLRRRSRNRRSKSRGRSHSRKR